MPSPHHHHHHRCCCCCCSNSSHCCSSINSSPPPSLPTSDSLQALAALLLHSQSPPSLFSHQPLKAQQHHPSPPLHPLFRDAQHVDAYLSPFPHLHEQHLQQQQQLPNQHEAQPLIHSLLSRVAALELSFPRLSPSTSPPPLPPPPLTKHHQRRPLTTPPPPTPPACSYSSSSPSLRDLAARRIQAAFRRFLLRRSQTLRHLKDLAAMKSHLAALRSTLSDKARVDPSELSERAMVLLLRLDAIQSGDPMIREGKRTISKELARMLEFIDKVLVKEHQMCMDAIEIAGNGAIGGAFVEDRRRRGEVAEETPRVAKKVSFLEDGKRSRVSFRSRDQLAEELSDAGDQNAPVESLGREIMMNEARDHLRAERFHEISDDDERSSESSVDNSGRRERAKQFQNQNGKLGLSAPLPVQMEPRRNLI